MDKVNKRQETNVTQAVNTLAWEISKLKDVMYDDEYFESDKLVNKFASIVDPFIEQYGYDCHPYIKCLWEEIDYLMEKLTNSYEIVNSLTETLFDVTDIGRNYIGSIMSLIGKFGRGVHTFMAEMEEYGWLEEI